MRHAGDDTHLTVFCEGGTDWVLERHKLSSLASIEQLESRELEEFRSIFGNFIQARGGDIVRKEGSTDLFQLKYNFRHDALRFSFKAFSYSKALTKDLSNFSHLCWIDADVIAQASFSTDALKPALPIGATIASYLGRTAFPPDHPYSECGFVCFNLNQPISLEFIKQFIDAYTSGKLFLEAQWHDCVLFDSLRRKYEALGYNFHNISGEHHAKEHPFIESHLGNFFDHLKGPARKARGYS